MNAGSCRRPAATGRGGRRPVSACSAPNLQFMVASTFPRISEQTRLYTSVLDEAAGAPVTFRTLDIGGDKVLPYIPLAGRREPGARLAGDPPVARPARPAAHPAARHAASACGGRRPPADAADGDRSFARSPRRARSSTARCGISRALPIICRPASSWAPCWKCRRCCSSSTTCCRWSISSRSVPTI